MQKTVLSRQQLIALVVLTLMWGVNWPMMKLSLQQLQPLHFRTLTMGLGMLCLAIYFKSRGVRLMPQNRQDWITIGVLAVPNMLGWHGLSIFGLQQLQREPFAAPKLVLSDRIPDYAVTGQYQPKWLELVEPSDFWLEGYEHHAPLTAPMAV